MLYLALAALPRNAECECEELEPAPSPLQVFYQGSVLDFEQPFRRATMAELVQVRQEAFYFVNRYF